MKYIVAFVLGMLIGTLQLDEMSTNTSNAQVIEYSQNVERYQNELYERYSLMLNRIERLELYHE